MASPAEHRATAIRWMEEVWNNRCDELVAEMMHPEAIGHIEGGQIRGHAAFLEFRNALIGAMPDLRVHIDGSLAEDDCVALRWRVTGTHSGDGLGIAPRNTPVEFRGVSWLRFEDGRLAEGWDCWNQGALMTRLQAAALV